MRRWPPATTWGCASTPRPSPCSTMPRDAHCERLVTTWPRRAPSQPEPLVADLLLSSVSKRFGATPAVQGLHLEVRSGDFLVLLGPSGAGKTTTLRLVAGLETPDQGSVHIGG